MLLLNEIIEKIGQREYEFSKHAVDQSIVRSISVRELEEAFLNNPQVVEDYPQDKYGPSCLVLGFTHSGRPLHVQLSYPLRPLLKIITLYEPNPAVWIDHRIRRSK
ncbi:DUF4258 domain-containing protein [Desulfonatronum parangueonense]